MVKSSRFSLYGINHEDSNAMLIKIKVYGSQVDYVKARPIHTFQQEKQTMVGVSLAIG